LLSLIYNDDVSAYPLMEIDPLAQMETASYCPGVRDNRYRRQLEIAPEYSDQFNRNESLLQGKFW
jgi:hypothetical protein